MVQRWRSVHRRCQRRDRRQRKSARHVGTGRWRRSCLYACCGRLVAAGLLESVEYRGPGQLRLHARAERRWLDASGKRIWRRQQCDRHRRQPTDNSAANAGAVYVFTRSVGTWSQQAYLKASNTGASDRFGTALAVSADGSTLAVGASGEGSNAIGDRRRSVKQSGRRIRRGVRVYA